MNFSVVKAGTFFMWPSLMVHFKCFDCKSYIFLLYDKSTDRNLCCLHFFFCKFHIFYRQTTCIIFSLYLVVWRYLQWWHFSNIIFFSTFFRKIYISFHFSNFIFIHIMFQMIFHIFSSWPEEGKL